MKSGRRFRLNYEDANLGPERRVGLFPSGFETLWVNNRISREIQTDDEIAHDGKVYVVISKEEGSDDLSKAVAFTVSYEHSDMPTATMSTPDPDWPDTIG
jgi:hypothetical protein